MSDKHYLVEVKVRNNLLLKKIKEAGFDTMAEFCRRFDLNPVFVSAVATFKISAQKSSGEWRSHFLKIAEALRCLPEDICPPQHRQTALKKNTSSFEASPEEVVGYISGSAECSAPAIDHIIDRENNERVSQILSQRLTPREERIIRARFGMTPDGKEKTYVELAEELNLSRAYINIIEHRAIRKLRGGPQAKELAKINYGEEFGSVNLKTHYVPEWKKQN